MSDINYFELLSDADVVDAAVVGSTATKKSSGLYLSITEVFSILEFLCKTVNVL